MAPMKHLSINYSSNHYGEAVAPTGRANVLASCYMMNSSGSLKGFHYCTPGVTGLPSPPSSPPLAAITSSNDVALLSKSSNTVGSAMPRSSRRARGGAPLIREECERFFCETMRAAFHGERNTACCSSGVISVDILTPPCNDSDHHHNDGNIGHHGDLFDRHHRSEVVDYLTVGNAIRHNNNHNNSNNSKGDLYFRSGAISPPVTGARVTAWMEIWDFVTGPSLRAFVATNNGEEHKSLFVFLHDGVMARELKQTLVALIELAEEPLGCSDIVLCIDRSIPQDEAEGLMKNLQWVGFELTTLDRWAKDVDVTSSRWVYMGMEV